MLTLKFNPGRCVATPGAIDAITEAGQEPGDFLDRHVSGDWGECCPDDAAANDAALLDEARIFSVYQTTRGDKLWVITEADRSSTTILLPDEY